MEPAESFYYVLSWNAIFHGTKGDVGRRLAEIWRVLKPGGEAAPDFAAMSLSFTRG